MLWVLTDVAGWAILCFGIYTENNRQKFCATLVGGVLLFIAGHLS